MFLACGRVVLGGATQSCYPCSLVAVANQMQVRSRSVRRTLALVVAAWFVLCGFLAARHEARTAHWTDRSGQIRHAVVSQAHTATLSFEASSSAVDLDPCELAHVLHTPSYVGHATPNTEVLRGEQVAACLDLVDDVPRVMRAVLSLAPKTSPPLVG
jgi:hypothetical protein